MLKYTNSKKKRSRNLIHVGKEIEEKQKFKTKKNNKRKIGESLKYSQAMEYDNSLDINRHRGRFLLEISKTQYQKRPSVSTISSKKNQLLSQLNRSHDTHLRHQQERLKNLPFTHRRETLVWSELKYGQRSSSLVFRVP